MSTRSAGPAGPRKRTLPTPQSSISSSPSTSYPPSRRPSAGVPAAQHAYASMPYNLEDDNTVEYMPILPFQNGQQTPIMMESHELENSPAIRSQPGYSGKRPYYISLSEAVTDDSQPEFDAQKLYPAGGNGFSSDISANYASVKSPTLFPGGLPKPSKKHPFAQGYEPPNWRLVIIHAVICLIAYPIMEIFVVIAQGRSLFWSRLIIGAGCGIIGFVLGLSLLRMGRSILEAATWATIIHQSKIPDGPGVRLKDLAVHTEDPTSSWSALRLLWDRHTYAGAARDYRKAYDRRPWSLYILFFLALIASAACLPFILGRIVAISTSLRYQHETYEEITIYADSSPDDMKRATALAAYFNDFRLTWTLAPFSTHGAIPPVVTFPWGASNNETVYFSETSISQLVPNGSGFGTFESNVSASLTSNTNDTADALGGKTTNPSAGVDPGSTIRYPRWGIRIKCAKLTDPSNINPRSQGNFTYIFTPREVLRSLFNSFTLPLPAIYEQPLNITATFAPVDTVPSTLNVSAITMGAYFYDNGVAHSLKSVPLDMGEGGKGFTTIESVLVRLNTTFTPNGNFLAYSDQSIPDVNGAATRIGYDAAVCLELYEPWVLETYNSTLGSPTTVRIVDKSPVIQDSGGIIEKRSKALPTDPNVKYSLNSTMLTDVYIAAHTNSVNQIIKDNGRDNNYVPSPTLISFTTGGDGPFAYTELSAEAFGKARVMADAANALPYFAGSGLTLARRYPDRVVSSADIQPVLMVVVLLVVLLMGIVAALFVPKLPLSAPRRGFEIYSWLAAFNAEELVGDKSIPGIGRNMELEQIAEQVGDLKFRYVS